MASTRRFPTPWQVEQIPGGYKFLDADHQASSTSFFLTDMPRREDAPDLFGICHVRKMELCFFSLKLLAGPTVTLKKKPELLRLRLEKVTRPRCEGARKAALLQGSVVWMGGVGSASSATKI